MNKELLDMVLPSQTEEQIRELCRSKKEELGFDIEKALFPINPLKVEPSIELAEAVKLCEEWNSVRNSVWVSEWFKLRGSIQDSIWNSIRDSVWDSEWDLARDSVWDSVWDSAWGSVKGLVCDSVCDSVWKGELLRSSIQDSIIDSIEAYASTIFFNVKFEHDFRSAVKLWESGYIASFDGEKWRLHTHNGVVWTGEFK